MVGKALRPRLGWLKRYSFDAALKDTTAGLILSILLVPQAMAYAQLAGLPPEAGLFAALLPPVLYLVFGTSTYVSMGPVALVSLVIAEAASGAGEDATLAASIIAIEAGVLLFAVGALGLGRLVNFISEPVLLGFTAAAAFLIAFSQLPTLLGIETARAGNLPAAVAALWANLASLDPITTAVGVAALVALLTIGRYAAPLLWKAGVHPPYRQAIAKTLPLVVVVGAALAALLVAGTVPTVASVEARMPGFALPAAPVGQWLALAPSSVVVAIIVFVTAAAVAKSLAGTDRSALDTSREAVALGTGNIAAALSGGYAVGASLSRSALIEDSGARSRLASVVGSLVVLSVLLLLSPLLAYLPKTALAALVISAVFGLVKLADIKAVWRHDRVEGWIILLSFLATLGLGVRMGLAVGAILGLAHFLWFSSVPRVTRLGSDDGGQTFRSVDRKGFAIETLPVLVVRIDRSIYFGNSSYCEDEIFARMAEHDGVECLVLDMSSVNSIDASGAAMLRRLTQRLHEEQVTVHFAAMHEPVRQALTSLDKGSCRFHRTVEMALDSCGVPLDNGIAYT